VSGNEFRILIAASFGHFVCHYNVSVFPALVLPLAARLNLGAGQVVELSFLQYLLFGVSALPWGLMGDRLGGKRLLIVMFLGCSLAAVLAALSIDSPAWLYLSLGGLGLFSGIYHPTGMAMISKGVLRLNLALGYNAAFGGLGMVIAPLVTGIVNWLWGPRTAFLLVMALNLSGVTLLMLLLRSDPEREVTPKPETWTGMRFEFLLFLGAMVFAGMIITGATVILPAYLELRTSGLFEAMEGLWGAKPSSNLFATAVTALVYCVGMLGQFTGGVVGERFKPIVSYLWFHCVCLFIAFLMALTTNLPLVFLSNIYFFFLLGTQAMENTVFASLVPPHLHHSAFGIKYIIYFGAGAFAVKMVSWIESVWGSAAVFIGLALVSALLIIAVRILMFRMSETA
jgi:MFS family permease